MHRQFLDLLCCPATQESLNLEAHETLSNGLVISGQLVTLSGMRYPIIRGIPRFVEAEHYAGSFGYQWNRWPRVQFESENIGRPLQGHTTRMWETITQISHVQNQTIVEFGCGPGRFLDVIRQKGGRAVGIDLSMAVEAARSNFEDDPDVLIVQGDVFNPPFREGSFSGGYSIGVFHHTPDPSQALRAMAQTVQAGGWIACSVYPNHGFYAYPSVARHRYWNSLLKPVLGYKLALLYAYFSAYIIAPLFAKGISARTGRRLIHYLEANWLPCLHYLPDVRWRLLDTFDAITPAIASTHTGEEVENWILDVGCRNVHASEWGDTAYVGVKN